MSVPPHPPDPLSPYHRVVVHGRGLAALATLPALLAGVACVRPSQHRRLPGQAVLAWGRKPSARAAQAWAAARGLPLLRLEDGFLRSVGLGHHAPPWSVVVDDVGIYYDAHQPSRLEVLIGQARGAAELVRGQALVAGWRHARVSKYNHAREQAACAQPGDVLVVDQTRGDAAIAFGMAGPRSFDLMLEAALDEHPQARVLLKVHPDVIAGRKRGHFDRLTPGQAARVRCLSADVHPPSLLQRVAAVYAVSSQMGFEALLWGVPVRCFGMPFYAGWGLTQDALPAPVRRGAATLPGLALAALADYARCIHPETLALCAAEDLMAWTAEQRRQREHLPAQVTALGFSAWKRPLVRSFLAGSQVRFQAPSGPQPPAGEAVVVWGRQPAPAGRPVIRLEDGFLRSVGLGADLVPPMSWVVDDLGIYYDTRQPSRLTRLLMDTDFDPALCERAARLRHSILGAGLSKYNLGGRLWQRPAAAAGRPVVLVVGQVETDAAIRHGAPGVCTNLALVQAARADRPEAWLIYKPHPDVVARLRARGVGEQDIHRHCDEVLSDVAIESLLPQVDGVQVMTSLAGFEALLRGIPLTVWGCPFYAGWGLSDDRHPQPGPRRPLTLDALVAGVLILYPRYVSRISHAFCTPECALQELLAWRDRDRSQPVPWRQALFMRAKRAVLRVAAWWRARHPA